jgi:hypothetical protein
VIWTVVAGASWLAASRKWRGLVSLLVMSRLPSQPLVKA